MWNVLFPDPVFSSPDDQLWFTQSLIAADYVIATQIRSLFYPLDNFLESHLIFVTQWGCFPEPQLNTLLNKSKTTFQYKYILT